MDQGLVGFLLAGLVVLTIVLYNNPKAIAAVKSRLPSGSGKIEWMKIFTHSAFVVFAGIIMIFAATAWLLPVVWQKFLWGNKTLLVWILIGVPFLVFLKSAKGSDGKVKPIAGSMAKVLQFVLLVGFVWQTWLNPYWKDNSLNSQLQVSAPTQPTNTTVLAYGVDAILRNVVCKPETECRQTYANGPHKGEVIVNVNKDGSKDIGILQINDKTWETKAKKRGLDLYKEEDNIAFGKILVTELGLGYGPWAQNFDKWGPEIGEPISMVVDAPVGKFGLEIKYPHRTGSTLQQNGGFAKYRIRKRGEKGTVEFDLGPDLVFRSKEVGKVLGIQLMSLEKEPVKVTLQYQPGPVLVSKNKV